MGPVEELVQKICSFKLFLNNYVQQLGFGPGFSDYKLLYGLGYIGTTRYQLIGHYCIHFRWALLGPYKKGTEIDFRHLRGLQTFLYFFCTPL